MFTADNEGTFINIDSKLAVPTMVITKDAFEIIS